MKILKIKKLKSKKLKIKTIIKYQKNNKKIQYHFHQYVNFVIHNVLLINN